MKQFLLVVGILCLLTLLGVGVLIVTFDADRYRPLLVRQLEHALGAPVELSRLSLGWQRGIAIRLQGLAVQEEGAPEREPIIQVESAAALIRLLPLLRKRVDVASVVLTRPRLHVRRDAQGRINLLALAAASHHQAAATAGPDSRAAPSDSAAPIAGRVVSAEAPPLLFDIDSLRLEAGSVHWSDARTSPPAELWIRSLDLTVRNVSRSTPMDLRAQGALGTEAVNLHVSGRLTLPGEGTAGSMEQLTLAVTDLPLEPVLPPVPPGAPQLKGILTLTARGSATSLHPAQWSRTLSASGELTLDQPVIANLNILRAVFERFSMLPGLVALLEARLPPEYQAKLAAKDTVLSPVEVAVRIDDGALRFEELQVQTDAFVLTGAGRVGFDRSAQIRATLRIEPALSEALIKSMNELRGLANSRGELELPLTVQGQLPRVTVMPDLNYVTSKLVVTTVQDLLGEVLHKALERAAPATPSP